MTARLLNNGFISFEQVEFAGDPDGSPSPLRLAEVLGYFGSVALFIATIALMIEVAISDDFLLGGVVFVDWVFFALSGYALLRLSSGERRMVRAECMATVGAVSNPDRKNTKIAASQCNIFTSVQNSVY